MLTKRTEQFFLSPSLSLSLLCAQITVDHADRHFVRKFSMSDQGEGAGEAENQQSGIGGECVLRFEEGIRVYVLYLTTEPTLV